MKTETYFFNENTSKKVILEKLKTNDTNVHSYIDTITKMRIGNKIGYFQFLENNIYYKFYIMPKIYNVEEGEVKKNDTYKKLFINFFKHYYRLKNKYNINQYSNELEGNISDLSYSTKKLNKKFMYSEINDIDDFIVHNYLDSIEIIKRFFNKHNKKTFVEKDYYSQSIKNKLNLKRNFLSLNKNQIHQTKKVSLSYSKIANIAYIVLENFLLKKIKNFSNSINAKVLKKETNIVINKIKKDFFIKNESFLIQDILSNQIYKLFRKNKEYKLLYKALLKLSSKEHYFNGDKYIELKKEEETISLFFQPEKLYEWIVYDKIIELDFYDEILKCDKDDIKKVYTLEPNNVTYKSEPDFVAIKDGILYPIDAKWKILDNKNDALDNDIFKLRRDALIRSTNKGYLIYPKKSETSTFKENTPYNYSFDNNFTFEVKIINIDDL